MIFCFKKSHKQKITLQTSVQSNESQFVKNEPYFKFKNIMNLCDHFCKLKSTKSLKKIRDYRDRSRHLQICIQALYLLSYWLYLTTTLNIVVNKLDERGQLSSLLRNSSNSVLLLAPPARFFAHFITYHLLTTSVRNILSLLSETLSFPSLRRYHSCG